MNSKYLPISKGCCDAIRIFGKTTAMRCNDYLIELNLLQRLVLCALKIRRENTKAWNQHKIPTWKVKVANIFISNKKDDCFWSYYPLTNGK